MTSKNLFFKRFKQDLDQRVWLPIVFFIICFLSMEMPLFSIFDHWRDAMDFYRLAQAYLANQFFTPNSNMTLLSVMMALVCALSGFGYMHSSQKLDVYHSIPVKRETLFLQQYCYGVIYYFVPLLVHVIFCLGIAGINGVLGAGILVHALAYALVQLLMFMACYSVVIVAICLTGNAVVSMLGSIVLLLYSMVLAILKSELVKRFFVTYHEGADALDFLPFSPIHLIVNISADAELADSWSYLDFGGHYAGLLLLTVIYTVFALFLYRKRPTEAAGNSIAYSVTEPIIKTMVVFPVSVIFGYSFESIFYRSSGIGWFLFGCIFGFIIICPLMEIIFRKDIKAVFSHPLQILFNGALVFGTIAVLYFDVFGYDTYVPVENKVESYAVSLTDFQPVFVNNDNAYTRCLQNMKITDNESVRKLVEYAADTTRPLLRGTDGYCNMMVKYNLKNGKSEYRNYYIDISDEQVLQWIGDIHDDMEYKKAVYPILAENREENYVGVLLEYAYGSENIPLSGDKMDKLVETYRQELAELTFEEIQNDYPVAIFDFALGSPEGKGEVGAGYVAEQTAGAEVMEKDRTTFEYFGTEGGYRIYPAFTKTIALLEEYGADFNNSLSVEDVVSINICDSSLEENDFDGLLTKLIELEYRTDNGQQEEIAEIVPCIVYDSFMGDFTAAGKIAPNISVEIFYNCDGVEGHKYGYFLKGELPEFLQEDIAKAAEKLEP